MKKLFTLALALSVAFVGYSQVRTMSYKDYNPKSAVMQKANGLEAVNALENVQSQPNMTRTDGELDYSTYDWQSNAGARTWTITWPDGKVNFGFTIATTSNYSDRGTGIGTYDAVADEWIPLGGRIESEKTGFGSIARYGANGIVVAAHTSSDLGIYIVEDKDNMAPNSVAASLYVGSEDYTHPAVMTSGPNRNIIHVAAAKFQGYEGDVYEPIRYWRSSDGGQTWDKECVEIPYLSAEYGINWGTNSYYWMETSESNRLALVINNSWSDGFVLYSDDNGETWGKKTFYHHPGILATYPESGWGFGYPRWTSCQWGVDGQLCMAYEWNGSNDVATSTSGGYFPGMGGVAFWSENLPYDGEGYAEFGYDPTNPMPPTTGQPFLIDSAYVYNDLYAAWPRWSDQTWDNPVYFGYVPCLTDNGEWESWDDAESFNIEDFTLHGSYNSGVSAWPVLCVVPGSNGWDLVTVYSSMDENNTDGNGKFFYKLFAAYSGDGGRTWGSMTHLTNDFLYSYSECAYPQATIVGNTLVIACQMDGQTGTNVQNEEGTGADPDDNYYAGLTFDLNELFGDNVGVGEQTNNNVHMTIYPNPAVDQLNVTLSKNADIVVYNMTGQVVRTQEGRIGANSIDLSGLTAGVYFVNAGSDTQKFIVK